MCSINISHLDVRNSSIFSTPDTGLTIRMDNISLGISADGSIFHHKFSVAVSIKGLSLSLGVLAVPDGVGQLLINVTSCSFIVGDLDIKSQ